MDINQVLPKIRTELTYESFEENNQKFISLIDPFGYAENSIPLQFDILQILEMLNGQTTVKDLLIEIGSSLSEHDIESVSNLISYLDYLGYLDTPKFQEIKINIDDYKNSNIRESVCDGVSYPVEEEDLRKFLNGIITLGDNWNIPNNASAVIAPHIDFRIGAEALRAYSAAYQALKGNEPDLVVILGTSHFGNSDLLMFTEKNFQTPLGIVETDKNLIRELKNNLSYELTLDDMAHRQEHSIEIQLVLLQELFKNKQFKILPILTGSLHNFVELNANPLGNPQIAELFLKLKNVIENNYKNVIYIASADFAHIGRKFGNDFDAEPILPQLKIEDEELILNLINCDSLGFFNAISREKDKRQICGLSPIFTLLNIVNPAKSQYLDYEQWNEKEQASAVSFASISYYN